MASDVVINSCMYTFLSCAGDSSSYEIARLYGTDVSGHRTSTSDDNPLPFPNQSRPSTSRGDAGDSGGVAGLGRSGAVPASPTPCGSRRRSSSPAAWPPRPASMSLSANELDSDDDDDDARPASCSSQGAKSRDLRRDDEPSPTDESRGKQPATRSRDMSTRSRGHGVNIAAKNRHRPVTVVTSSVTSEPSDDVEVAPSH